MVYAVALTCVMYTMMDAMMNAVLFACGTNVSLSHGCECPERLCRVLNV